MAGIGPGFKPLVRTHMEGSLELAVRAVLIGLGATLVMDLWAIAQARLFGVKPLDYALVGRWLGHMPAGRFRHVSIASAPYVRGERVVGWVAHYLIGVGFAGLLLAVFGEDWARKPTLWPAFITGVLTAIAPLFIMQPCLGLGIAASRLPNPNMARLRSLLTHLVFGLGLYASAWLLTRGP
jgi:hypothetical protein